MALLQKLYSATVSTAVAPAIETVGATAKMWESFVDFGYLLPNGVIANFVLRDLDLLFEGQIFNNLNL